MTTGPAAAFHTAQEAALRGSTALLAAMGGALRIYTEVPPDAPLPYVVIGADEIYDESDGCGEAHTIVSTVQWWAALADAVKGSATVRAMGEAITGALYRDDFEIEGHATVLCDLEAPVTYGTDPDNSSRGRLVLRYETTAQSS